MYRGITSPHDTTTPRRTKGPDKATWASPDYDVIQSARDVVAASRGARQSSALDQNDDRVRAEVAKVKATKPRGSYDGSPIVQDELMKVRNAVKASPAGINTSQVTATPPPFLPSPIVYDVHSRDSVLSDEDAVGQLQRAISGRESRASRMLAEKEGLVAQQSRELAEMEGRMNEMREMHAIQVANLENKAAALQRQVQKALTNESRMSPKKNVIELESKYRESVLRAESAENESKRLSEELRNATDLLHAMQDDVNKERLANANIISQTRLDIRKELEQAHLDIVEDQRQGFEDEVTARELANKRQIDSLVTELESLKREFVIVENECEQYKRECRDATEELKKHKSELALAGLTDAQSLEELKGQNERNLLIINDLKIMNKRLQGREGALEARIVELELAAGLAQEEAAGEERMKAASELHRIQERHRLQSKKDAEELGRLRGMLSAVEAKLELSEESSASFEAKLDQAQRKLAEIEAANVAVSNQVDLREMEIEHAENKISQLEKTLAENRALLGRQAGQLQASQDRSAILEARLSELEEKSDLSERVSASMTAESSEARVTIELQAAELQKARHHHEQLELKVEELSKKLQEHRIELEQTTGYLESCRVKLQQSEDRSLGLEAALAQQASTLRSQLQVDAENAFTNRLTRERTEWEAASMQLEQHLSVACQRRIWQASAAADAVRSADVLKSLAKSYARLRLFSGIQKLRSSKNVNDRLIEERDSARRRVLQLQEEYDVLQHEGVMLSAEAQENYDRMIKLKIRGVAAQCLHIAGRHAQEGILHRYMFIWIRWLGRTSTDKKTSTIKAVVSSAMEGRSTRHVISAAFHAWYRWALLMKIKALLHANAGLKEGLEVSETKSKATIGSLDRTLNETIERFNAQVEARKELEFKNEVLVKEVEKYRTTCESLKEMNKDWQKAREDNSILEREVEDLKRQASVAEHEVVTLMAKMDEGQKAVVQAQNDAREKIESSEELVREKEAANEALKAELESKEQEAEANLRELVQAQEKLHDLEGQKDELEQLQEKLSEIKKEKDEKNHDFERAREKINALEQRIAAERERCQQLMDDIDNRKKALTIAEHEKAEIINKMNSMHNAEAELRTKRDECNELAARIEALTTNLEEEKERADELKAANLKLEGELEAEMRKQTFTMMRDDTPSKKDEVIRTLKEQLQERENDITKLQKLRDESIEDELVRTTSNTAADIIDSVKALHEDAIDEYRRELQALVSESRSRLTAMSQELKELEKDRAAADEQRRHYEERQLEFEETKRQLDALRREQEEAEAQRERLFKELEAAQEERRIPMTPERGPAENPTHDDTVRTQPVASPPFSDTGSVEPPNPPSPHIEPLESAPPASPSSPLGDKDRRRPPQGNIVLSDDDRDKVRWIFDYGDADRDGYLNYEELKQLSEATSGQLDRPQYEDILKVLQADTRGLNLRHLEKLYCDLGSPGDVEDNYNSLQNRMQVRQEPLPVAAEPVEPPHIPASEEPQIESPRAYEEEAPASPPREPEVTEQQYIESPPPPSPPQVEVPEVASPSSHASEHSASPIPASPPPASPEAASPSPEIPESEPASSPVPASPQMTTEPSSPEPASEARSRSGSVSSMMSRASSRKAPTYPYGKLGSIPFKITPASTRGEVAVKVASSIKAIPKGALIVEVTNSHTRETTKVATRAHFAKATENVLEGTTVIFKVVTDAAYIKEWEGELARMGKKTKFPHEVVKKKGAALFKDYTVPVAALDAVKKENMLKTVQTRAKKVKAAVNAERMLKLQIDPESLRTLLFKDTKDIVGHDGLKTVLKKLETTCGYPAPPAEKVNILSTEGFNELWVAARDHYLHSFDRETRDKTKAK